VTVSAPGFDFLLRIIVQHKIEVKLNREHGRGAHSRHEDAPTAGKILTQAKRDINPHLTFPVAFLCTSGEKARRLSGPFHFEPLRRLFHALSCDLDLQRRLFHGLALDPQPQRRPLHSLALYAASFARK
jgi:hypothetical protein